MCFIIREKQRLKIAKKDITCYKVVKLKGINQYKGVLKSYVKNFKYDLNTLYPKIDNFEISIHYYNTLKYSKNRGVINEGYHSFSNYNKAIGWLNPFVDSIVIKCIIPKGSKYFYDPIGEECVSDQIKTLGKNEITLSPKRMYKYSLDQIK